MPVLNYDSIHDPFVFNADRNTWMAGGGTHSWNGSYQWTFTSPLFINWLAGRSSGNATRQGTATYNQCIAQTVTIPLNNVAYVTLDPNTDGAALTVSVCAGSALPQGDNIFVLAMHRDLGLSPNNPILLRWGNTIGVGQSYNASSGIPVIGFASNYSGTTWTVNHSLNSTDVIVQCQDNSSPKQLIFPQTIEFTSTSTITITFSTSVTGRVQVIKIA
jgi:hypothetical protein